MAVSSIAGTSTPRPRRPATRIRYASFESRVAATALDVLVLLIIAALLILAGSIVILVSSDFERVDPSETSITIFWACAGAIAPAWLLYFFIGLSWKGQTIGKSVMQLMVIRSDGRPLGVLGSMARVIGLLIYVVFLGAGIIAAYTFKSSPVIAGVSIGIACLFVAIGLLWAALDSRRRTLHDRIAGTIVVRIE